MAYKMQKLAEDVLLIQVIITLTKSGPWIIEASIEASCTVDEPGNWTATYSNAYYKVGEQVAYH